MIQKIFCSLLFTLCCFATNAQKKLLYFNYEWKPCKETEAKYVGELNKLDTVWHRVDYSLPTGQLLKRGFYKDETCNIKHGIFEYFFGNGNLSEQEQYFNNQKTGLRFSVYPNGMLCDSFQFKNGIPYGIGTSWYSNGNLKIEMQMDTMGNGSGLVIGFFNDGTVSFKGKLATGLRKTGNWFYYHQNGKRASVLQYSQVDTSTQYPPPQIKYDLYESIYYDSTITYTNAICYDTSGVEQQACKIENSFPEYEKGLNGWTSYLSRTLYSIVLSNGNLSKPITFIANFMVDSKGNPSDIMLDNSLNERFDSDILMLFKKSRKWKPARHNNRIIPFMHKQSLTLGVNM